MSDGPVAGMAALPEVLPIFPLPGALLLPRGRLPLNVFEARYLNLVSDALGQGRILGMTQTIREHDHPIGAKAEIYPTGCAGRISTFAETGDERFLITLTGVCRFRVFQELEPTRGYRRVRADYGPFGADLDPDEGRLEDRQRLMGLVRRYLTLKGIQVDWKAMGNASDEALVIALSMISPFDPEEKQALLESSGVGGRGAILETLMDMSIRNSRTPDSMARH